MGEALEGGGDPFSFVRSPSSGTQASLRAFQTSPWISPMLDSTRPPFFAIAALVRAAILLLSSAVNLSRQDAHEAGIASVLVKPVRNSYLLRRIVDSLITTPTPRSPAGTQQKEAHRGERASSPAR